MYILSSICTFQSKALKKLCKGSFDPGLMQEQRVTKVMARSLGQVMSTMVVLELDLWLNLAEMCDANKVCLLDAAVF